MAEDEDYWFVPHRYGLGGVPVTWQGWALIGGYVAGMIAARHFLPPLARVPVYVVLTVPMLTIAAAKTKGGWKWRWGEEE